MQKLLEVQDRNRREIEIIDRSFLKYQYWGEVKIPPNLFGSAIDNI